MNYNERVTKNIRYKMTMEKITSIQLSEKIDVNTRRIRSILRGENKFSIKDLVKLAEVFDTTIQELVTVDFESNKSFDADSGYDKRVDEVVEVIKELDDCQKEFLIQVIKGLHRVVNHQD